MTKEIAVDVLEQYPYEVLDIRIGRDYPFFEIFLRTDECMIKIMAKPNSDSVYFPRCAYSLSQMLLQDKWTIRSFTVETRN